MTFLPNAAGRHRKTFALVCLFLIAFIGVAQGWHVCSALQVSLGHEITSTADSPSEFCPTCVIGHSLSATPQAVVPFAFKASVTLAAPAIALPPVFFGSFGLYIRPPPAR